MTQPTGPGRPQPVTERAGTVLETDDDLRQALLSAPRGRQLHVPVEAGAAPPPPPSPASRPASPYRPTARPPVPLLTVFDDGKIEGEVVRIRTPRFTIGRTEGDLTFPMDGRMSARHVEVTHQLVGGLHRWVLTDLQSTHGLFVRVSKTALADGAEFLVGGGRYRFESNQPTRDATADYLPPGGAPAETQGWAGEAPGFRPPALTELLGREIGNRLMLVKGEYWIGTDPSCAVCRPDDPFCEGRHVRVYQSPRGGWHAEHNKTPNGLWLRVNQVAVESSVQFQIGEQRFKLRVG